jgi:hypothetical protein
MHALQLPNMQILSAISTLPFARVCVHLVPVGFHENDMVSLQLPDIHIPSTIRTLRFAQCVWTFGSRLIPLSVALVGD